MAPDIGALRSVRAVVFDVGETLVDETRAWSVLADQAGVTRLTLFAALGALVALDADHRLVWSLLGVDRPEDDVAIEAADFYPDALSCLRAVREAGYTVGLAGNQPAAAEAALRRLGLPVDFIASSSRWGFEKPAPVFFDRIRAEVGLCPEQVAYVGDRLDNDVLPAKAAGMFAVFIRRGPWGHLHAHRADAACADVRVDSLAELASFSRSSDASPDGRARPGRLSRSSGRQAVRFPPDLRNELRARAQAEQIAEAEVVRRAVHDYLERPRAS